ncbi:MAG: beta-ketoacyl-ACP synthase II [Eubacteriales bacterium]
MGISVMKRRVVITGMGAVTPLGNTVEDFWREVQLGTCGIDEITSYDTSEQRVKLAAQVKNLDFTEYIDKSELRKMDTFTKFAVIAAKEAVNDSGITLDDSNRHQCGVMISSGIGGLDTIAKEHERGSKRGFDKVSPFFIPMAIGNIAAGTVAIQHNITGICNCVVTACAGGTNAIGDAFRYIRDGYAQMMVCGGSEASITPFGIGGFTALHALSESTDKNRASIPFDANRNGFVMGEGAGILFLEEYEQAIARGASIYAEVVGYGVSCDAHHITAPDPTGAGACKSMLNALADASIQPTDIGYINAHGTSTPLNDKGETLAVKEAFGDHAKELLISSTKSMTGHLLGASGAIEAIIMTKALQDSYIPATINYQIPDPDCDLNIVPNTGVSREISYALSNSLGFGGHNATLIFRKCE